MWQRITTFPLWLLLIIIGVGGCEYGDVHGTAASFDRILGLKVKPAGIVALRHGGVEFTGCFVFLFPAQNEHFFKSPPDSFFQHPVPLSYEASKTFVTWRPGPASPRHAAIINEAIRLAQGIGLQDALAVEMIALATSASGFYAMSYEQNAAQRRHNIDVYLLDPSTRKLYHITDTNTVFETFHIRNGTKPSTG